MKGTKVTFGRRLLAVLLTVLMFASGNVQVFAQVVEGTLADLANSTHTIRVTTDEIAAAITRGQSEDFATEELELEGVKTEVLDETTGVEAPAEDIEASEEEVSAPENKGGENVEDKEPAGGESATDGPKDDVSSSEGDASSESNAPASSEANAPASSESGEPASSEANAPASSEVESHASSEAQAPASSETGSDNGGSTGGDSAPAAGSDNGGSTGGDSAPAAGSDNGGGSTGGDSAPAGGSDNGGGSTGGDSAPAGGSNGGGSAGGDSAPAASTLGAFIRNAGVMDSGSSSDDTEETEDSVGASLDLKIDNRETQTYDLDPEIKALFDENELRFPLDSVTFKHEMAKMMEGKLLVKFISSIAESCEDCQAIVAVDPESGELLAIGINASEEQHGFKLEVVDSNGAPIDLGEVKSVISVAVKKELSGKALEKLLAEAADNENKEVEVTQVVVDASADIDVSSKADAPESSTEDKEPAGGNGGGSDNGGGSANDTKNEASSTPNEPASSETSTPASSESGEPASSEASTPASSETSAPASSEADAPASSEAQAPASSEASTDNGGSTGGESAPAAGSDNGGSTGGNAGGGESAPAGGSDNGGSTGGSTTPAASTLGAFIRFEANTSTVDATELDQIVNDSTAVSATVTEITKKDADPNKVTRSASSITAFSTMNPAWKNPDLPDQEDGFIRIFAVDENDQPRSNLQVRLVDGINMFDPIYAPNKTGVAIDETLGYVDIGYTKLKFNVVYIEYKAGETWVKAAEMFGAGVVPSTGSSPITLPGTNAVAVAQYLQPVAKAKWITPKINQETSYRNPLDPAYYTSKPQVVLYTLPYVDGEGFFVESRISGGNASDRDVFTYEVKIGATPYNGQAMVFEMGSTENGTPVAVTNGVFTMKAGQYAKFVAAPGDAYTVTQTSMPGGYTLDRLVANGTLFTSNTYTDKVRVVDGELETNRVSFTNKQAPSVSHATATKARGESTGEAYTYDIKLTIEDTPGYNPGNIGADVVVIMDLSNSMNWGKTPNNEPGYVEGQRWYDLQHAAHRMITALLENGNNRVAVVGYGGTLNVDRTSYTDDIIFNSGFAADAATLDRFYYSNAAGTMDIKKMYEANGKEFFGNTNGQAGLIAARELIDSAQGNGRQKYVVFMTDGEMTASVMSEGVIQGSTTNDRHNERALYSARLLNSMFPDTKIYTAGFGEAKKAVVNPSGKDRYHDAYFDGANGIDDAFQQILAEIGTQSTNLTITDPMSEFVTFQGIVGEGGALITELPEGVKVENGTLTWAPGSINGKLELTYRVTVNENELPPAESYGPEYGNVLDGTGYPANKKTDFTYTKSDGSKDGGILDTPRVPGRVTNGKGGQLSVTKQSDINGGLREPYTFTLTRDNGIAVANEKYTVNGKTATTNAFGEFTLLPGQTARFDDLTQGENNVRTTYVITENSPTGNVPSYTVKNAVKGNTEGSEFVNGASATGIQLSDGVEAVVVFKNAPVNGYGSFTVTKESAAGASIPEDMAFTFKVTFDGKTLPAEYTVNGVTGTKHLENGEMKLAVGQTATFANVPKGTQLSVTETENSDYPVVGNATQTATLGDNTKLTFVNDQFAGQTLTVEKLGAVRGAEGTQPLDGVKFELKKDGRTFQTLTTAGGNGTATYEFKKGESGTFTLEETSLGSAWENEYTLTSGTLATITVSATGALSIKKGAGDVTVADNTVAVKNALINASITINKTDADGGAKLDGAEFALYTSKDEGGNTGKTATTVNGTAKFENLAYGKYYVKETAAPKGYNLPTDPWTEVTLGTANVNATLPITNAQKTVDVKLSKTAEDTGLGMVGVKFDLYKGAAKVNTYTTATGGVLTVAGLTAGSYYFVENGKVDGYLANTAKYAFTISLDEATGNLVVSGDAVTNGTVSVVNKPSYSKTNSITVNKTAERIDGVDKENFTFTLTGTPDDNTLTAGETKTIAMSASSVASPYTGSTTFAMAGGKAFPIGSYKLAETSTSKYWMMESFVVTVTTGDVEATYGANETFRIEANTTSVVATVKNIAKPLAGTTIVINEKVTASAGFTPEEHTYTFTGPNTSVNGAISAPANVTTPITWGADTSISATQVGEYKLQRTDNMENKRLVLEDITVVMNGVTTTVESLDKLSLLLDSDSNGKTITVTLNYKELAFSTVTVEKKLAAGTPVNVGDTFTVTFTGSAAAGRPNSSATVVLTVGAKKNVELQTGLTYTVTEAPATGYTLTSMADANTANPMVKGEGAAYNYTLNAATGAVTVTNTLTDTASLTLTKEITNNGGKPLNANDEFVLKVWRERRPETEQTVTLKAGESKTLENLNAGQTYLIREELAADSNYKLTSITGATNQGDGYWAVTPGGAVTVQNAVKMGSISVLKLDAATGEALTGAEFTATRTNSGDTAFKQKIAGDGKAVAVPFGTYEVVETTAPAGYAATTKAYTVTVNDETATVAVGEAVGNKFGVPNTFNKADGTVVTVSKTLTSGAWLVPAGGEEFSFEIRKGGAEGTPVGKASVTIAQDSTTANATFTAMNDSKLALDQGVYYVVETAPGANFEFASISGTDSYTGDGTGGVVGTAYVFTVNTANNKVDRQIAVSVNNADKTSGPDKSITAQKVLTSGAGMNADFTITIKDPAGATHTGTTKGSADGAPVALDTTITNFHMGTYVVSETASAGAWTTSYKLVDAANANNVKNPDSGKNNEFTLGLADLDKNWVLVVTNTANNDGTIVLNKLIKDGENDGVIVNSGEEFVFTLKKGDTDVTLTQDDVPGATVKDGKLYVKPGQTVTIKNLTLGESYTLTEDTTGHPDYTFRSITTAEQTSNTGSSITVNMLPQVNIESISDNIHNSLVTVEKIVSGMNLYATEFTITLTPEAKFTNAKPASVTLKPAAGVGQSASSTVDLIHGVTYTVSEKVPALYQIANVSAGSITVSGTAQTVTVTNKMVDANLNNSTVLANKVFDGGANGLTGTFGLTITGPKNIGGTTGAISADGAFTLDEFTTLPIGDYEVKETMDAETAKLFESVGVSVTVSEGALKLPASTDGKFSITEKTTKVEITVTNRVKTLGGDNTISVDKVIAQGAGLGETFTITLTDSGEGSDNNSYAKDTGAGTGVIALTAAQSRLGVYTISELLPSANWADPTFELVNSANRIEKIDAVDGKFTLGASAAGKSWVFVVTNKANSTGSIEIQKNISGKLINETDSFTFVVTGPGLPGGSKTVTVVGNDKTTVEGLILGETYTVTETVDPNSNYNFKEITHKAVTVTEPVDGKATLNVPVAGKETVVSTSTNKTTSTEVGEVTVRKVVNGTNLYLDTTFTAVFTSGDSVITQGDLIAGAAATPVAGLIYGLTYTVTETLPANSPYQNVNISTTSFTAGATPKAVTITNEMKANKDVDISAKKMFENGRTNGLTEQFNITITGEGATINGKTNETMQGATFTLDYVKDNGLKPGTYTVTENLDAEKSQFEKAPYAGGTNISITMNGTTELPAGQNTFEVTDTTSSVAITVQNRIRTLGTGSSLTVQKQLANGVGLASTFTLKLIRPDGTEDSGEVASTAIGDVNTPVDAFNVTGENLQLGTYTIDETFGTGEAALWNAPTYTLYRGTGDTTGTVLDDSRKFTLTTADIGNALRLVVTNKTMDNGQINLKKILNGVDVDVDGTWFEFTVYESDGTTPVDLTGRIGNLGDKKTVNYENGKLYVKAGYTAQLTDFTIGSSYVIAESDNQPNYNLDGLAIGTEASAVTEKNAQVTVNMGGTAQNAVSVSSNKLTNANEVTLTKLIDGTNPNANPQNFTVTFEPTTGESVTGEVTVDAGEIRSNTVNVTGLLYGMTYTLTETVPTGYAFKSFGGTEGSLNGTATVTVEAGKSKAVTVTNTPASKNLDGKVLANKTIASNPGNAEEAFEITIQGTSENTTGFTATGKTEVTATGGAFTFTGNPFTAMKVGTYTVVETKATNFDQNSITVVVDNGAAGKVTSEDTFAITVNTVGVTITVDNTVRELPAGNFSVEKLVVGEGLTDQAFTITVTGPAGVVATGTVNGAATINATAALPIGTYNVTEIFGEAQATSWATPVYTLYRGAADTTGTLLEGNTFEITADDMGETLRLVVTNTTAMGGSIEIQKNINGVLVNPDDTFTFVVKGPGLPEAGETVTVKGKDAFKLGNLKLGETYTVTETVDANSNYAFESLVFGTTTKLPGDVTGGKVAVDVAVTGAMTVVSTSGNKLTTNEVTLEKVVTGENLASASFNITFTPSVGGTEGIITAARTVDAGIDATSGATPVAGLIYGVTYTVAENTLPDGYKLSTNGIQVNSSTETKTIVVTEANKGTTQAVVVTNEMETPSIDNITATKTFVDSPAGNVANVADTFTLEITGPQSFKATATATNANTGFDFGEQLKGIKPGTYTIKELAAANGNYEPVNFDGETSNVMVTVTNAGTTTTTYGAFTLTPNTTKVSITVQNKLGTFSANDAAKLAVTETLLERAGQNRYFTFKLYDANTETQSLIATKTVEITEAGKTDVTGFVAEGTTDITKLPYGRYTLSVEPTKADGTVDSVVKLASSALNDVAGTVSEYAFTATKDSKTKIDFTHTVKTSSAEITVEKLLSGIKNFPGTNTEVKFTLSGGGKTYTGIATFDATTEQVTVTWKDGNNTIPTLTNLFAGDYTLTEITELEDFDFGGITGDAPKGTADAKKYTFTLTGDETGTYSILSTSNVKTDGEITIQKLADKNNNTTGRESDYAYFARTGAQFTFTITPADSGIKLTPEKSTVTVGVVGIAGVSELPRGIYTVKELIPEGANYSFVEWDDGSTNAQRKLTLSGNTASITATNKLNTAELPFSLTKEFDVNGLTSAADEFTFTLTSEDGATVYNGTLDEDNKVLWTLADSTIAGAFELYLPVGNYALAEASTNPNITFGHFTLGGQKAANTVVVTETTADLAYTATNVAVSGMATLALSKSFAFNGTEIEPPFAEDFTFTVYDYKGNVAQKDGKDVTLTLNAGNDYTANVRLPYGAYTVKETSTSANYEFGSWVGGTGDKFSFTLDTTTPEATVTAQAVNNVKSFNASNISVSELVNDLGGETSADFTFELRNAAGVAVETATVTVTNGNTEAIKPFTGTYPVGSYSVVITTPDGRYTLKNVAVDGAAATISGGSASFNVTGELTGKITVKYTHDLNTYTGKLTFVKALEGGTALSEQETFLFTLTGAGRTYEGSVKGAGDIVWKLPDNTTATVITGLPGGTYTVTEKAATNFTLSGVYASGEGAFGTANVANRTFTFTLPDNGVGSDHVITFTNAVKADGVVTVTKTASNELGGKSESDYARFQRLGTEFTFKLTAKDGKTYTAKTKVGGTATFDGLPYGNYTLEEVVPANAGYSFDSWTDGGAAQKAITVLGNTGNSYTAVNTAHFGTITIVKESSRGGKLSATFQIIDKATGKTVDTIVTNATTGLATTKLLPAGTYVVHESIVPANHTAAADVELTITANGQAIVKTIVNTYKTTGGGGGGDGPWYPGGDPPTNIPDGDIPLAAIPEELKEIPDEQIPLANLPNTGGFAAGSLAIIGTILLGIGLRLRRKDDQEA